MENRDDTREEEKQTRRRSITQRLCHGDAWRVVPVEDIGFLEEPLGYVKFELSSGGMVTIHHSEIALFGPEIEVLETRELIATKLRLKGNNGMELDVVERTTAIAAAIRFAQKQTERFR